MPVICRLPQGGGFSEVLNFPISIQTTQPSPKDIGHIWVKANISSSITKIKILEAVSATESDGTLMLVTSLLPLGDYSVSHEKELVNGGNKIISMSSISGNAEADWLVTNITDGASLTIKLKRPIVYSKLGGILDVETSYMWNGSSWVLLCEKGSYIMYSLRNGSNYDTNIYNLINGYTPQFNAKLGTSTNVMTTFERLSQTGKYALANTTIYKRVGDVWQSYTRLSTASHNAESSHRFAISDTGICAFVNPNGNSCTLNIFKDNGVDKFDFLTSAIFSSSSSYSPRLAMSPDASVIVVWHLWGGDNGFHAEAIFRNQDGTYDTVNPVIINSGNYTDNFTVGFVDDYLILASYEPSTYYICRYKLNVALKTVSGETYLNTGMPYSDDPYRHLVTASNGYCFAVRGANLGCFNVISNTACTLTGSVPSSPINGMALNVDGSTLLVQNNGTLRIYSVTYNGTTVSLTQRYTTTTTTYSNLAICPTIKA